MRRQHRVVIILRLIPRRLSTARLLLAGFLFLQVLLPQRPAQRHLASNHLSFATHLHSHLSLLVQKISVYRRESAAGNNLETLDSPSEPHQNDPLTEQVLGAIFEVSNTLGGGFLEKVYQRALLHELRFRGIKAASEVSLPVTYKSHNVGDYYADILVEDVLIIELKCAGHFSNEHTAQCINYLRASGRTLCLLVNFQKPKVEWRRIVYNYQTP